MTKSNRNLILKHYKQREAEITEEMWDTHYQHIALRRLLKELPDKFGFKRMRKYIEKLSGELRDEVVTLARDRYSLKLKREHREAKG